MQSARNCPDGTGLGGGNNLPRKGLFESCSQKTLPQSRVARAKFQFLQAAHSTRNSGPSLICKAQSGMDDRAQLRAFADSGCECRRTRLTAPESVRAMNADARDSARTWRVVCWQVSRERCRAAFSSVLARSVAPKPNLGTQPSVLDRSEA